MEKKYLAKIIANDQEGLQMISACSARAKVKVLDIKYLASNKVFLLSIERTKVETGQDNKKINSICRFDFVDKVKSKNIDQSNQELVLELVGIDYLKTGDKYCDVHGSRIRCNSDDPVQDDIFFRDLLQKKVLDR